MPHPEKIIQKLGTGRNRFLRDVSWQLYLNRSRIYKREGSRMLVYHGVCKNNPFRFNTLFVTLKNFERQLQVYKKYFQVVSLDDFYQKNYNDKKFTLCLTFDDGFANNYKYVLPLLEKYQMPASFFITAIRKSGYDILWNDVLSIAGAYGPDKVKIKEIDFLKDKLKKYLSIESGKSLNEILRSASFEDKVEMMKQFDIYKNKVEEDYWLQMTEGQIKKMSESKWVTLGSHSYCHNDLAYVAGGLVRDDLLQSKNYLEGLIQKKVRSIAFPYGSYSKQTVSEAKAAGYTQLLATDFLFDDDFEDKAMKERLTINPFISPINQMHANICGHYR